MWLINTQTLRLESFEGDRIPQYAILSHRWEEDEVSFKDMQKQRRQCQHRKGFQKIQASCQQALADKLNYVWVDTCCIDKRSSAELSEAINSMFRWYQKSQICYAFLSDINLESDSFINSQWFTRGWTLQELLAPNDLIFFDATWRSIGSKLALVSAISRRTGIEIRALESFNPADYCIAQKMKWAAGRQTTRIEDRSYSLLGLLQIHMPLLYGEAENAFSRLQREVISTFNDTSIFMASAYLNQDFGMLASCPESYTESNLQELNSYQCRFASTKIGIVGTFGLYRFALDIYAVDLHKVGALRHKVFRYMLPLIRWNLETGQFQRVVVDGKYYTTTSYSSETSEFVGRREIHIGTLPLEMVSSTSLSLLQTQSYMGSVPVADKELFIDCGVISVDSEPVEKLPFSDVLEFADSIDEQLRFTRQCLCLGQYEWTPSSFRLSLAMAIHFGKNREGEPTAFITAVGDGTQPEGFSHKRYNCQPDGYLWHAEMGFGFPPSKSGRFKWCAKIDDIDEADHKIMKIGQILQIHFVRAYLNLSKSDTLRNWRVYIECQAKDCYRQIPKGWRLPDDRMVGLDVHYPTHS